MVTSAVLSVLLVILKYNEEQGSEFISKVATDNGLMVGDPRKALNRYLRQTTTKPYLTGKKGVNNEILARACAKAWNMYVAKETTDRIRIGQVERKSSIVIAGSPYK